MRYVDVILPVPLEGTFTYSISEEMAARCVLGMRVLVPFGKSKTYTGLAVKLHDNPPDLPPEKVRDVIALLDEQPIVTPMQLRLWQWIATYYMCSVGEVLKAALPSGLKADTEYRPKKEAYVALAMQFHSEKSLHVAIDMLRQSPRQQQMLACYLQLSHWDSFWTEAEEEDTGLSASLAKEQLIPEGIKEITREELLNVSHGTSALLKNLLTRGVLVSYDKVVGRLNDAGGPHPEFIKPLNEPQADAYNHILMQWMKHNVVLLHGVTSSGKTEIYIHLIEKTLAEGKQVLYLLPEIALTVQITQRLQRVFGHRMAIYHSKYSDAERVEIWRKQLSQNPYDIILGVRSSVFLPFQRLGLVIVDEEHETSYKQQDPAPRYHARSVAIVLAQMMGAKTLLGTATPAMETYFNTMNGKYGLVTLTQRYKGIELPEIDVVDVKDLRHRKMMNGPFSPHLLQAIREALAQNQQVILFQNRRGFAPMVECKVCGWVPKCKNCDVTLTYHKRLNLLTCHYCGYTMPVPEACPCCGNTHLSGRGYGTEKIEDQIRELFPEARVARMDLDTTRTRNAYERLITDFSRGKTNLLIGTQMISKGLDFDRVQVVGILDADAMLNYPDFRAYEHAFMMMAQVSGRAGRHGKRGLVVLQTRDPQSPVVQQVVNHDFQSFYEDLLAERELFHYPPFYHLIYIYLRHKSDTLVETAAQEMGGRLRQVFADRVLGPDKPAIAKVKTLFIRKIVLKIENALDLNLVRRNLHTIEQQMLQDKSYSQLQIVFDVDPM
jgi:primosomal protein N' (replication factor Y)